jgi:hypothetical protein
VDPTRFDALARTFAIGGSRRRVIAVFLGGLLAALGGGNGAMALGCRGVGRSCRENANCCSGLCKASFTGPSACRCVADLDCPTPCGVGPACAGLAACEEGNCRPKQCWIGKTIVPSGSRNPANPCQVCNPNRNWDGWSNQNDGTLCGNPTGEPCVSDFSKCQAGVCVPEPRPDDADCGSGRVCCGGICCESGDVCDNGVCDDSKPVDPPGEGCEDNPDDCPNECIIGGVRYQGGTPKPDNECQWCDPQASTTTWSMRPQGDPCGGIDSARICCLGVCCAPRCSCEQPVGTCQNLEFCESIIIDFPPEEGE